MNVKKLAAKTILFSVLIAFFEVIIVCGAEEKGVILWKTVLITHFVIAFFLTIIWAIFTVLNED